jgi:DNA invertase Pin-like site-specific DNA recombinase
MRNPVPPRTKVFRCAIYTRKSSEEGLEQDFNSLHAQRESCDAYIKSQRHEGWAALPSLYDDGGYSGGSTERPALKRLLADIQSHLIDVVVVYKVDRLTRSLTDFAKIVEIFDAAGVSFVSVTQQFNTTTSMGRLTLNVLLSFAQFEREVTGERIRDKIAASKQKGMWMGGWVPIGYDRKDRTLTINETEAVTVRMIFDLFLKLKNVQRVQTELARLKLTTKPYATPRGRTVGGLSFARGHLYKIMSSPLYIGRLSTKVSGILVSIRPWLTPRHGTPSRPSLRPIITKIGPGLTRRVKACSRGSFMTTPAIGSSSAMRPRTASVTDITSHQRGLGVPSQRLAYQGSGFLPPRSTSWC